jgi:hypothetical protein
MKFTLQMFWERKGEIEPMTKPLTLNFESADEVRGVFSQILGNPKVPLHSVTLASEDGNVSERWFQIDGVWRRKDA